MKRRESILQERELHSIKMEIAEAEMELMIVKLENAVIESIKRCYKVIEKTQKYIRMKIFANPKKSNQTQMNASKFQHKLYSRRQLKWKT